MNYVLSGARGVMSSGKAKDIDELLKRTEGRFFTETKRYICHTYGFITVKTVKEYYKDSGFLLEIDEQ